MWIRIVIGLGAFLGLSLVAAFALIRTIEAIGLQVSEVYGAEWLDDLPPTR
jgi:hypothetical protein